MHRPGPRSLCAALLLALAGACNLAESPTAPSEGPVTLGPSFTLGSASGKVLGSTNQGELVEIDLDAGTVTLVGDAGVFAGDSVGWTDIAFDDSGTLFGLSRIFFESEFEVHLYAIDPGTGAVDSVIGSAGDATFSDFDHDGTEFYGSGGEDGVFGCCGQLFTIDATDASVTWISSDTLGYGLNPYDTVGASGPIARGGFAVHPITGDLWGIEALQSQATVLYRIDPTTGLADSILKVGPPEYGYDALHILDDGTFITTRGGQNFPRDSVLWEISSTPDSTGLVEIQLIPLTFDTLIVGNLNGLEDGSPPGQETFVLSIAADTTELHPWVQEPSQTGDTTTVNVLAKIGESVQEGVVVAVRAEFLSSGGHEAHITSPLDFDSAVTHVYGGTNPQAQAVTGYFKQGEMRSKSLTDTTDANGAIAFAFVAGWIGGSVDLIAGAKIGTDSIVDTLRFTLRVPELVALQSDQKAIDNALFVGGTSHHPQFENWHVTAAVRDSLALFAERMHDFDGTRFPQFNDASLSFGGAFSVTPPQGPNGVRVDAPFRPHNSHAIGVDIDVAICWSTTSGATSGQVGRVSPVEDPEDVFTCPSEADVDAAELGVRASALGFQVIPEGDHYHLRYAGN